MELEAVELPLEMAPAPPLISLRTGPAHRGQRSNAGSDIFCRASKRLSHESH
jgi:hypothetical protein